MQCAKSGPCAAPATGHGPCADHLRNTTGLIESDVGYSGANATSFRCASSPRFGRASLSPALTLWAG